GLRSVPRRRRAYRAARGGCPRATRIARRALSTHVSQSLEHLACHDALLDLRRPLVDLRDHGVAEVGLGLGLANRRAAPEHLPRRPPSSVASAMWKPRPSSPSRWAAGTRHASNTSSAVSEARMPSLSSVLLTEKPGVFFSTTNALTPRCA